MFTGNGVPRAVIADVGPKLRLLKRTVAGLGAIAMLMTGCAGTPAATSALPAPSPTATRVTQAPRTSTPTPSVTEAALAATCAELLELANEDRERQFADAVVTYSKSGVTSGPADEALKKLCSGADGSENLDDLLKAATTPTCDAFVDQPENVQSKWLEGIRDESGSDESPPLESMVAQCAKDLSESLIDAFSEVDDAHSEIATAYSTVTWTTETRLGFTQKNALHVGNRVNQPEHPLSSDNNPFLAGTACDFDPETDVVVPLTLTATNTTSEESREVTARVTLQAKSSRSLVTSAYLEWMFASGPSCSDAASSGTGAQITVLWSDPIQSQEDVRGLGFVLIKNYFSPRYPQGAHHELASYVLSGSPVAGTDDPMHLVQSHPMSLDEGR